MYDTVLSDDVRLNDTGSVNKDCSNSVNGDEEFRSPNSEYTGAIS